MKYGESTFDILYLVFAITNGWIILRRAKNVAIRRVGMIYGQGTIRLGFAGLRKT